MENIKERVSKKLEEYKSEIDEHKTQINLLLSKVEPFEKIQRNSKKLKSKSNLENRIEINNGEYVEKKMSCESMAKYDITLNEFMTLHQDYLIQFDDPLINQFFSFYESNRHIFKKMLCVELKPNPIVQILNRTMCCEDYSDYLLGNKPIFKYKGSDICLQNNKNNDLLALNLKKEHQIEDTIISKI